MSDDDDKAKEMTAPPAEVDPGRYDGPSRAAPYPLSRLAPSYDLVDVAREIQRADETLATMTGGKLGLIAAQIQRLQDEARALLEKAQRDAVLHRAECRFEKKAGDVYHLYRREDGTRWFSLLGPDEWKVSKQASFEGTYRLELDMSFTRLDTDEGTAPVVPVKNLLGT